MSPSKPVIHFAGGDLFPSITEMKVDRFTVPLPTPMEASAAGVMQAFDMVAVRLADSDGAEGVGYTVMHAGQGGSVGTMIEQPLRQIIIGADPDRIEWIWRQMYKGHHYAGRGAPLSFALAAVDVALWDT